ncbi:hypothetical protein O9929_24030 [Vibrio lentus]|nr:hypothetical protein [Vibrio lentus]
MIIAITVFIVSGGTQFMPQTVFSVLAHFLVLLFRTNRNRNLDGMLFVLLFGSQHAMAGIIFHSQQLK